MDNHMDYLKDRLDAVPLRKIPIPQHAQPRHSDHQNKNKVIRTDFDTSTR